MPFPFFPIFLFQNMDFKQEERGEREEFLCPVLRGLCASSVASVSKSRARSARPTLEHPSIGLIPCIKFID